MADKSEAKATKIAAAAIPVKLYERIEAYRARMAKTFPGSKPTMSDAMRALLEKGLTAR